jgi:hypothetical protein
MVAHTSNSSTQKAEVGGLRPVWVHSKVLSEIKQNKAKKEKRRKEERIEIYLTRSKFKMLHWQEVLS